MENLLTYLPAEFSAGLHCADDLVVYEGKVFEAGQYPDKDFDIDENELAAKAAAFQGVDLDLEHSRFKDVLGNSLGRLESIWNQGSEAIGRLKVPRWLHELAGGKLQTSLSFDCDKNIVGCALTLSPRIADAQVIAAFRFCSERSLQERSSVEALKRSREGQDFLDSSSRVPLNASEAKRSSASTLRQPPYQIPKKEITCMSISFKDRLRLLFGSAPEATREAGIDPRELDKVEFTDPEPRVDPAIQAQLIDFKATNDRLVASQLAIAATIFADEVLRSAKAVPAQREQVIALYKSAAMADGQGVVRFSDNGQVEEGANLAALRDLFKNALPHSLFTTQIPNADPNADATTPDPAMVERLRGATSLGQQTKKEAN